MENENSMRAFFKQLRDLDPKADLQGLLDFVATLPSINPHEDFVGQLVSGMTP